MKNDLKIIQLASGHWVQTFSEWGREPYLIVEDEQYRVLVFPTIGSVCAATDFLTRAFQDASRLKLH